MSDFLEHLVKDLADENTTLAVEGKSSAEFSSFIDTGSYVLNAVLSGSYASAGDMNQDSVLDVLDVVLLINTILS